ncbi:S8 family serine peptidase [Geodermatophilus sp. URMC 64]
MSRGIPGRTLRALTALTTGALASVVLAAPAEAADLGYDTSGKGALFNIAQVVGAHASYTAGYTGKGIGVALIDTGVSEVPGLDTGNVWHGPDLSFDSQSPELAHLDAYGHGTHLASVIAGRDQAGTPASYLDPTRFTGIAPDSTLVSLKVGAHDGAVDVSQVIAAIDWAVEHRNDPGLNIRVINLSYGTDSSQDPAVDPLAFAVENAWKHGIVVVAAGGNDGSSTYSLANPARDPYVVAVGVDDSKGTVDTRDDDVPAWGTRGTNQRHVDVVAPGVSVVGLRVPNGYADLQHPESRVGSRFAKASGTSQAAAVVSGEVALLLQENPALTPDQVKQKLMTTAESVPRESNQYRGNGVADARIAQVAGDNAARQSVAFYGTGTGSLEAARGSSHVSDGVAPISGEVDIFGNAWDGAAWAAATANETVWDGGTWRGLPMTGDGWDGRTWRSADWSGQSWTGQSWTGLRWTGLRWTGQSWTGQSWTGQSWTGQSWTGLRWTGQSWTGQSWRSADLASVGWS